MIPAHLAPLAEPGAFYRAHDGQVIRSSGGPVLDPQLSLSVACDMAVEAPSEDRAALWMLQVADLISAMREARAAQPQLERAA